MQDESETPQTDTEEEPQEKSTEVPAKPVSKKKKAAKKRIQVIMHEEENTEVSAPAVAETVDTPPEEPAAPEPTENEEVSKVVDQPAEVEDENKESPAIPATEPTTAPEIPEGLEQITEETLTEPPVTEATEPNDEAQVTPADQEIAAAPSDAATQPDAEVAAEQGAAEIPPSAEPEDPGADAAVNDIAATDSDALLKAEDEKLAAAFTPLKPGLKQKIRDFLVAWWRNGIARWGTIVALLLVIVALATIPFTRYFILNTAGVRASASLSVLDDTTQLPLKNVQVKVAGQTATSDDQGNVTLAHLKLGANNLEIQKLAFAPLTKKIVIGWGSNPLGAMKLTSIGTKYVFNVTDFLSGKPIANVQATSGEANALSDKTGQIILSISKTNEQTVPVTIQADSYRDEHVTLPVTPGAPTTVKLVPARKQVFVSKRSGNYDVYKVDIDGKNEQLVLAGTGAERDDIVLAANPAGDQAALISTRDTVHNSDGFLLSTLTLLDLKTNGTTKLAQSERIQIVGWSGTRLVFVQIAAGASAASPKRNRLLSYDYTTQETNELASSNYFNDVLLAAGNVYYAPSAAYQSSPASVIRVSADGKSRQAIINQEVWNLFHTAYDHITLAIAGGQDWYDYLLGAGAPTKLTAPPANPQNRTYIDSPDGQHSLWVDNRDGKGVLLAYDTTKKADSVLYSQNGLKYPVNWISNEVVVFRINTDQETADYALNIDGGAPVKIRDVTNTTGLVSWYYY